MRGVRRLLALINALPAEAALWRRLEPSAAGWTTSDELLAIVAERVGALSRLFIQAWSSKRPSPASLPDPTIVRPYHDGGVSSSSSSPSYASPSDRHRPRRQSSKEELKRFMGRRIRYTPREG